MKFLAVLSVLALSAVTSAAPVEAEAAAPGFLPLEARFNCGDKRPRCPGGSHIENTHCLCDAQVGPCTLRACPDGHRVRAELQKCAIPKKNDNADELTGGLRHQG